VPGRSKGPATVERTRSRGCGQDLVCKGDEVHRVSRRCEVATRVSPSAQLAHHRERCSGCLPQACAAHGEEATAAGANSNIPPLSVWSGGPPWRVGKHKRAQTAIGPSQSPSRSLETARPVGRASALGVCPGAKVSGSQHKPLRRFRDPKRSGGLIFPPNPTRSGNQRRLRKLESCIITHRCALVAVLCSFTLLLAVRFNTLRHLLQPAARALPYLYCRLILLLLSCSSSRGSATRTHSVLYIPTDIPSLIVNKHSSCSRSPLPLPPSISITTASWIQEGIHEHICDSPPSPCAFLLTHPPPPPAPSPSTLCPLPLLHTRKVYRFTDTTRHLLPQL
jgi:hypothetical protein